MCLSVYTGTIFTVKLIHKANLFFFDSQEAIRYLKKQPLGLCCSVVFVIKLCKWWKCWCVIVYSCVHSDPVVFRRITTRPLMKQRREQREREDRRPSAHSNRNTANVRRILYIHSSYSIQIITAHYNQLTLLISDAPENTTTTSYTAKSVMPMFRSVFCSFSEADTHTHTL